MGTQVTWLKNFWAAPRRLYLNTGTKENAKNKVVRQFNRTWSGAGLHQSKPETCPSRPHQQRMLLYMGSSRPQNKGPTLQCYDLWNNNRDLTAGFALLELTVDPCLWEQFGDQLPRTCDRIPQLTEERERESESEGAREIDRFHSASCQSTALPQQLFSSFYYLKHTVSKGKETHIAHRQWKKKPSVLKCVLFLEFTI